MSSASAEIPSDVLQEIGYFEGGGPPWGCDLFGNDYEIGVQGSDYFRGYTDMPTDYIFGYYDFIEPYQPVSVYTCGWEDQEQLKVTLTFPSGRAISKTALGDRSHGTGSEPWGSAYDLEYGLTDPGTYTVSIEGENNTIERSFEVFYPIIGPRFAVTNYESNGHIPLEIFLYNFEPNEKIRLLVYTKREKNTDKQNISHSYILNVNQKGQRIIKLSEVDMKENPMLAFIGDISGEAALSGGWYADISKDFHTVKKQLKLYLKYFNKYPRKFWQNGFEILVFSLEGYKMIDSVYNGPIF